jgi:amidophosphoribosyltransferase
MPDRGVYNAGMCGFIGMIDEAPVAGRISVGMQTVQHRGQDSCGLYTFTGSRFPGRRGIGLVKDVFAPEIIEHLPGNVGIGHVRYPTVGKGVLADAQPFFERRPGVLMAHNGNLTNYEHLKTRLDGHSIHLLSGCDVEPMLCIFAEELMARRRRNHTTDDVVAALRSTLRICEGAFTVVMVLEIDGEPTLVAFRDPYGIRPGVLARRGPSWMVASESVAADALGFELVGDLEPGCAVFLRAGEEAVVRAIEVRTSAPCVFESIYFSRPDSIVGGDTIYARRLALGRHLARCWQAKGLEADRVIAVPDTSRPAAIAFAEDVGLPCREGFIKNRYCGRTFIMGSQEDRESALRLKLNLIRAEFEGQRVVIIDDSIVRGSTLRRLLDLVWAQGPAAVHVAIHAPPVLNPCFYGIDMSTPEELAATKYLPAGGAPRGGLDVLAQRRLEEAWAADLGVDSLTFLSMDRMNKMFAPERRCAACFDGIYPLPVPADQRRAIVRDRLCGRGG